MRVLFVIAVLGEGKGGHYHSLNHISREIGKINECSIVSLGPGTSDVLLKNPYFNCKISLNKFNYPLFFKTFNKEVESYNPDVIHFFDMFSYNIMRFSKSLKNRRVAMTKCGGPNPVLYPFIKNLIVFSKENYEWFKKSRKHKNINIYSIPNRVKKIEIRSESKSIEKSSCFFNFVRISRIGETYQKSIQDSINLIVYLKKRGYEKIRLYIIGSLEDDKTLKLLLKQIEGYEDMIQFVTSSDITSEASKMLYLADAIIGTGRGVMEASSLNIPVLTINNQDKYPILIDSSNFEDVFNKNFSERCVIENFNDKENLRKIEKLIEDKNYYQSLSKFSKEKFEKLYDIEKVRDRYSSFYKSVDLYEGLYYRDIPYIVRHLFVLYVTTCRYKR